MKNNAIKLMLCALTITTITNAQIVSDVSYLKGKRVEVAVSDCGTYGSGADGAIMAAPVGYHDNMPDGSLSYVNDWGEDGFDVGVPTECGDYVLPGSPEEGFAIQIGDGPVYGNLQAYCYRFGMIAPGSPDFSGGNITNINGGTFRKNIWQGTNTDLGLAINQTTYYSTKKQSFVTIVDICNGGDAIADVYYARNVDPDNDQVTNGTFLTKNDVKKQYATDGYSMVAASSTVASPCYMSYVAGDSRAKASRGNFSMGDPSDMWNGVGGYIQTTGAVNADEAIQISFKIDSIGHNTCDCVAFSTVFSPSLVSESVTLSNTACATLGTLARYGEDMVGAYIDNPDHFLHNEIFAYPNPSNGNFTLNLFEIENADITIVNTLGETVYSAKGVNKLTGIYLNNITPGLYFITAVHDGTSITKSIVIE